LLEKAIPAVKDDPQPLVDAVYWLENSVLLEQPNVPTALLKNVGLAHVHFVQSGNIGGGAMPEPSADLFGTTKAIGWPADKCKEWAATRFMHYWGMFLQRGEAKEDPQYGTIKQMYEAVQVRRGRGEGGQLSVVSS
jgi:hypothetical protein